MKCIGSRGNQTEETKKKIKATLLRKYASGEIIHNGIGKKHSKKHKLAISKSMLGKNTYKRTEKQKETLRNLRKGKPSPNKGKPMLWSSKEKHWNWKGGISKKDRLERLKFRQQIQKEVFERDNYTCQMCGNKGVALQVDHIQSWKDYVELRFDINNCRTLCADCHYEITYGKKKPNDIKSWGHNLKHIEGSVV